MTGTLRARLMEPRPPFTINLGASHTAQLMAELKEQLVVGLPIPPPTMKRRQTLCVALVAAQGQDCCPAQWPLGLLRASGWVILDNFSTKNNTICQEIRLIDDTKYFTNYLTAFAARGGVLGARILLYSYLRFYPDGHACLEPLRITLNRLMHQGPRPTIITLTLNAPQIVARHLLDTDPGNYLTRIGLSGELARGRFVAAIWRHLAAAVATAAPTIEFSPTLRVMLALSLDNNGTRLRFPELMAEFAEALLTPWLGSGTALPLGIRSLLMRYLGDPRVANTAWDGVATTTKQLLLSSL